MKYSFEEKKKRICITAALVFVVIAGVVYVNAGYPSGYAASEEYQPDDDTEEYQPDDAADGTGDETADTGVGKDSDASGQDAAELSDTVCYVHVCGAVHSPGVYELRYGSRISDAIQAAGGFAGNAADDYLNLAETVSDGQKIQVPTKKEAKNDSAGSTDKVSQEGKDTESGGVSGKVNINTADAGELMTLPGIGSTKAEDIIAYRQQNGRFSRIEDLMNIPGIKEGVFSKISERIIVD